MRYTVEYSPSFLDEFTKKLIRENFEVGHTGIYDIADIVEKQEEHQFLPEEMWKELKVYLELLLTEKVDYIEI
tara:strand:+ start:1919 stop:2137 length:219 start_codon:yes stop_codon:yes gene_type:complete